MRDIFSSKSFISRYGPAKTSDGPAKPIKTIKKASTLKNEGLSSEAEGELINSRFIGDDPKGETLTTEVKPKGEKKKSKKTARKRRVEGETSEESKTRRKGNKDTRKSQRRTKTREKAVEAQGDADKKIKKLNKTQAEVNSMKRSKAKAERLTKRSKRQEGRAERKKIRKEGREFDTIHSMYDGTLGQRYEPISKREAIKRSRKKQRE
mgnify:CR=1 FL=1